MTFTTSLALRWQRAQQIDPASIEPLGLGWFVVQQPRQPRVDGEESLSGAPPEAPLVARLGWRGQPEATLLIETKLIFPYGIPTARGPGNHERRGGECGGAAAGEDYRVVGLCGRPGENHMIYPWQLGAYKAA